MGAAATTTYFVGSYYEVVQTETGTQVTKYYYAGTQRIAMRQNGALSFILGDHLGSTSLATDANGVVISETRYKAWGEARYSSGTTPTKYQYTGQYSYTSDFGLHFYNARWYDSSLSRFAQADTIVPESTQGVQAWDRYAYANNSPIVHIDPSGHNVPVCYVCTIWRTVSDWWSGRDVGYNGPMLPLGHGPRQLIGKALGLSNSDKASDIGGLLARGLLQYEHSEFAGALLDAVKSDPVMDEKKQEIVSALKSDPRFGVEEFSDEFTDPDGVAFGGGQDGWLENPVGKLKAAVNVNTWAMRHADLNATATVTKDKNIQINFTATDTLDLVHEPDRGFWYNAITVSLGAYYHHYLGGGYMSTSASWSVNIPK